MDNPPMRKLLTRLSPVVPLCLLAGCAMSGEDEMKMSSEIVPKVEKDFGGTFGNASVQRYISDVGMRTARCSGREDIAWQFKVLDSPQINAFALPGGKVYITRGLLGRLENEAQLASILGHEIGHVVRGHADQQMERAQSMQDAATAAIIAGSTANGEMTPFVAGLRKNSRDQEREADLSGLNYIVRLGYDPQAMLRTMENLRDASAAESKPEFLATHPSSDDRLEYLQTEIDRRYGQMNQGATNTEQFRRVVFQGQ
jgi:predicted Zn-dependent protease